MEALIVGLLIALLALAGAGVWLLAQRRQPETNAEDAHRIEQQLIRDGERLQQQLTAMKQELAQSVDGSRQTVLGQVNALDQRMNERLAAVQGDVTKSLSSTTETIGEIGRQLGALGQSAERILEVGRDVSSLKDVLQPPKLRGGFGELLLEQLVKQVLPSEYYTTQHRFSDNTIVDMVINSPDGLVPIDSKFPIDSFRRLLEAEVEERDRARRAFVREVKLRIDEVAKYIRPDDGTLDFALMYVPAENVYYETIAGTEGESPMTYALERGVHLCSPNTFHAFLQVVLRGFRGLRVQEEAKEMMQRLGYFRREFAKFRQEFEVLGGHVGRAKNKYDDLDKAADRLSDKLEIDIPVQPALPEPSETQGQASLPRPAFVNGGRDDDGE